MQPIAGLYHYRTIFPMECSTVLTVKSFFDVPVFFSVFEFFSLFLVSYFYFTGETVHQVVQG